MNPSLSDALAERGYTTLTAVQEAVADPALAGSDLLVSAQTGSGKTVGFGLAIAPTLLGEETRFGRAEAPLALVVAPTRELAFQVMRELAWLYAKAGVRMASCVGGMDMRDERRALDRGAHIVVGTPGRLRDHIMRKSLDLSGLKTVVLDEADEMLDLGFREDLEFMLGEAPEDRRTLLFSATVSPQIARLAKSYQRDAQRINTVGTTDQHADISYQAIRVAPSDSEAAIFNILRYHDDQSAIVFVNTRAAVNHLLARLSNRGFSVVSLSGELSQTERTHALQAMRDGRAKVCVATDVAARGIDLPNLNLVIHADIPKNTEGLLHRSGRTGRAGRKGVSVLIVPPREVKKTERLLKWAKINAEWGAAPSAEEILRQDEDRLLNDPTWEAEATSDEAEFATKLLSGKSPEAVAAAYLRLYRERRSAPEELLPPDTKQPKRDHKEFGPSKWFALSVGRDDRAEPRWLLPLLCRAGRLDKSAIGAIRLQDKESFVEIAVASVDGFMSALGAGNELDEGITVRAVDGVPNLGPSGRGGPKGKPRFDGKKDGKPRFADKPKHEGKQPPHKPKPAAVDAPAEPKHDVSEAHKAKAPKKRAEDGTKKPRHKAANKGAGKKGPGPKAKGKPPAKGAPKAGAKPPFKGNPKGGKPKAGARVTNKKGGTEPPRRK